MLVVSVAPLRAETSEQAMNPRRQLPPRLNVVAGVTRPGWVN
jgi:hypothetical protein